MDLSWLTNGMNKLGQGLFPMDPATTQGMDPTQLDALRKQAMLKLGLGTMLGGARPGATLGSSLALGYGGATDDLQQSLQLGYHNARQNRMEQHDLQREAIGDTRYNQDREHALKREDVLDQRAEQERQDKLNYQKASLGVMRQELAQKAKVSPDEQARLDEAERNYSRAQELIAKPKRSKDEDLLLDYLLKGAVSNANHYPDWMSGGLGAPGAGGNPLVSDPRL